MMKSVRQGRRSTAGHLLLTRSTIRGVLCTGSRTGTWCGPSARYGIRVVCLSYYDAIFIISTAKELYLLFISKISQMSQKLPQFMILISIERAFKIVKFIGENNCVHLVALPF